MPAPGHAVGHHRRQQRFDRAKQSERDASGSTERIFSSEKGGSAGHGSWLGMPPKRIPMVSTESDIAQAALATIATANRIPGHIGRSLWNAR